MEDKNLIIKPTAFSLDKFKSKRAATVANVETLQGALPHYPMAQARDFVRLHPDEETYWSENSASCRADPRCEARHASLDRRRSRAGFLGNGKLLRFRLALATKPHDVFFLCHVPSQNLDNSWNMSVLAAAEQAKRLWVQVTSRKDGGRREPTRPPTPGP